MLLKEMSKEQLQVVIDDMQTAIVRKAQRLNKATRLLKKLIAEEEQPAE